MGIFGKFWGEEPEFEEENDLELEESLPRSKKSVDMIEEVSIDAPRKGNKVVNIHATAQLQVVLVKPERFEDVTGIADHLNAKKTVVLNLEVCDRDVSRRIIDFLSGAAYANHGNIRKVAVSTFIIVPADVDVMGELMLEELDEGRMYF